MPTVSTNRADASSYSLRRVGRASGAGGLVLPAGLSLDSVGVRQCDTGLFGLRTNLQ